MTKQFYLTDHQLKNTEVTGQKDNFIVLRGARIPTRLSVGPKIIKPTKHVTGNWMHSEEILKSPCYCLHVLWLWTKGWAFGGGGMSVLYFLLAVFWLALIALPGLQTRKHHTANIPDAKGNCSNSNPDSNLCVCQWQTTHRSVRIYISFNMVKHTTQQGS